MRADQILILGVGALGLYALYRMSKADNSALQPEPRITPRPTPVIPTGQLPDVPGPVSLPASVVSINGNPLQLTNSRAYFGRIETISMRGVASEPPFSPNATREQIQDVFLNLGFDGVRVYMNPTEASQVINTPEALANPGKGTRWVYGRWTNPTMSVARPANLVLLWVTRGLNPQIGGQILNPEMYPLRYPFILKY